MQPNTCAAHSRFSREIAPELGQTMARMASEFCGSNVSPSEIQRIAGRIRHVEERMAGRFAGDIEDYVLNFLFRVAAIEQAERFENPVHAEIGTLFGASALLTLEALQQRGVHQGVVCIDPLDGYYTNNAERGGPVDPVLGIKVDKATLFSNLRLFGHDPTRVELIPCLSRDPQALHRMEDATVVSLFIDGDHTYDGIKFDWEHYAGRVVPNGYVLIDNFNDHRWPQVSSFACEAIFCDSHHWRVIHAFNKSILLQRAPGSMSIGASLARCSAQFFQQEDRVRARDRSLADLKRENERRGQRIGDLATTQQKLHRDVEQLNDRIRELRQSLARRDRQIDGLQIGKAWRDRRIDELGRARQWRDGRIQQLVGRIEAMKAGLAWRDKRIEELGRARQWRHDRIQQLTAKIEAMKGGMRWRDRRIQALERAKTWRDGKIGAMTARLGQMRKGIAWRDQRIEGLQSGTVWRDGRIDDLQRAFHWRDRKIEDLTARLAEQRDGMKWRDGRIGGLVAGRDWRDGRIADLHRGRAWRDGRIADLTLAVEWRDKRCADLSARTEALERQNQHQQDTLNRLRVGLRGRLVAGLLRLLGIRL